MSAPINLAARRREMAAAAQCGATGQFGRVAPAAAKVKMRAESHSLYLALSVFAGHDGRCWPSNSLLVQRSRVERRHIHRAIRQLVEVGLIEVEHDARGKNRYRLLGVVATGGVAEVVATGGVEMSPRVATIVATGGVEMSPRVATIDATRGTRASRTSQRTAQMEQIPLGTPSGVRVCSPIETAFEEFWGEFPHRPADPKRAARAVFVNIVNSGVEAGLLIERARAHASNIEGLEPRYWTMAHKWLREECWADQTVPIHNQGTVAAVDRVLLGGPLRRVDERAARGTPEVPDTEWRAMLTEYMSTNRLSSTWLAMFPGRGLPPQKIGTRVPHRLRKEFGFD